jgi:hypothetical protein
MSCAGKGYGTNLQSDEYLYSQFISSGLITTSIPKGRIINGKNIQYDKSSLPKICVRLKKGYPSFTPELTGLSVTTSAAKAYTLVYVNGANFFPNDATFIQFGSLGYLPVTYYSSYSVSFVVPLSAVKGDYSVKVVNLYNGNFSPPVNQSYPGTLHFSQPITYTIT